VSKSSLTYILGLGIDLADPFVSSPTHSMPQLPVEARSSGAVTVSDVVANSATDTIAPEALKGHSAPTTPRSSDSGSTSYVSCVTTPAGLPLALELTGAVEHPLASAEETQAGAVPK